MVLGVRGLAALHLGVERQHHEPGLGRVAEGADRGAGVPEEEPRALLVVAEDLGDAVGIARGELGSEPRLERLHRRACLEPHDAVGDRHAQHRRPGAIVRRLDRAHRLDMRADPVFGVSEVCASAHRQPRGTKISARFVVVSRRRASLVEGVGLRDVRRDRGRFVVVVRLDLLRLLEREEIDRLRAFAPRFAELSDELVARDVSETVQHDDLHMSNVYAQGEQLRVLDWGDSSISHPFVSLVVTFRFLEEVTKLPPGDPWFARLRDAYLEPYGRGLEGAFALSMRVGAVAHAIAWLRQRDHLPAMERIEFDQWFRMVLRRAIAQTT